MKKLNKTVLFITAFLLSLGLVNAATLPTGDDLPIPLSESSRGTWANTYNDFLNRTVAILSTIFSSDGILKDEIINDKNLNLSNITLSDFTNDVGYLTSSITGNLKVNGTIFAINDGATSFRLRGVCDGTTDDNVFDSTCQSSAGVFYNSVYDDTGGTGARTTRAIYGSNEDMDLEIQGSNHIRLTAVDDNVGTGRIRMAAEDEIQVHAGVAAAETDNLVATFTGSGLDVNGEIRAINDGATSFRLRGKDFNGNDVQSYAGVFYNNVYDQTGSSKAKKTRVIYGSNPDMDLEIQGTNDIRITAIDNNNLGAEIRLASSGRLTLHPITVAETNSAKYLIVNAEGNIQGGDVELSTNSGDLILNPIGDVRIKNGFTGSCPSNSILTVVNGIITGCA